jgi:hypothetical protein
MYSGSSVRWNSRIQHVNKFSPDNLRDSIILNAPSSRTEYIKHSVRRYDNSLNVAASQTSKATEKPNSFDANEQEIMNKEPENGVRLFENVNLFLIFSHPAI